METALQTPFFLLCVILGFVLAWYFVRRDYKPVKELLGLCGFSGCEDEYSQIRNSMEESFAKNRSLENIAKKYKSNLYNAAMAQVLKGNTSKEKTEEIFKEYDIVIHFENLMVIAFDPLEFAAFLPNENLNKEQKYSEVSFIISNIFEELFNTPQSSGYTVNVDGNILFVASFKTGDKELYEDTVNYGLEMIKKYFELTLSVAHSSIQSGWEKLNIAYNEAMYVLEYKRMKKLRQSLSFADIQKKPKSGYHFSMEKEEKLINLLRGGNKEAAKAYVNTLFDQIEADKSLSLENIKILMFDIEATIFKTPELLSVKETEKVNLEKLLSCTTIQNLRETLIEYIDCGYFERNKLEEKTEYEKICEYIEKNYRDPNLNINSIGTHFDMYPAYLSKIFRKECGISMLDYINKHRINVSKELMKKDEMTILEISSYVGYGHIRTFNRVFKKYVGITPSAYRSELQENKEKPST